MSSHRAHTQLHPLDHLVELRRGGSLDVVLQRVAVNDAVVGRAGRRLYGWRIVQLGLRALFAASCAVLRLF